jgi:hypothetical protein
LRETKIWIENKQTETETKTARYEHRHREKTEIHKIETEAARQAENIERYKLINNSLKQRQTDGKAGTDRNLYIERHRHR